MLLFYEIFRLGVFSFYISGIHHNLIVKLLNDRYGIQVRGGCSCAGTYGHFLLGVDRSQSQEITDQINAGDFSSKPGWVRMSIHPTMSNDELEYILEALQSIVLHIEAWRKDYLFSPETAEFNHKDGERSARIAEWFAID